MGKKPTKDLLGPHASNYFEELRSKYVGHQSPNKILLDIELHDPRRYFVYKDDVVIARLFEYIGMYNKYAVDIGCGSNDSGDSNTYLFQKEHGFKRTAIDKKFNEAITRENTVELLEKYGTPKEFDLLSIDIDGVDFYILNEMLKNGYKPNIVTLEINSHLPPDVDMVIEYDPNFVFPGNLYYGASALAYTRLMNYYDYSLIHICTSNGIFLQNHFLKDIPILPIEKDFINNIEAHFIVPERTWYKPEI